MSKNIANIDWELWIKRPDLPILFTTMWFEVEGPMAKKVVGSGYTEQLVLHEQNFEWWIRSTSDFRKTEKDIRRYVNSLEHAAIEEIFFKANSVAESVEGFIQRIETYSTTELLNNFEQIVSGAEEIMFYTTSMPAFLLSALETAKEGEVHEYAFIEECSQRIRANSYYRDVRTKALARLIDAIASRFQIGVQSAESLTVSEARESLSLGKLIVLEATLIARSQCMYWDLGDSSIGFEYEINAMDEMKAKVEQRAAVEMREVKGAIGNKGIVRGIVKVVNIETEMDKVQQGDVLVAHSTNPVLLPAMHKAAAFVTDEGGIVSHAAIVAREMKKPCVIGTKIATQVFKDGDMVEVDAEKGIVRKL